MQSWCSLTRLWHERRSLEYVDEIFVAFPLNKRRASLFAFCCSRLKKKYFPLLRWNIEELRWQKLLNQSRESNVWTIAYPSKNIEIGFLILQHFYQAAALLFAKKVSIEWKKDWSTVRIWQEEPKRCHDPSWFCPLGYDDIDPFSYNIRSLLKDVAYFIKFKTNMSKLKANIAHFAYARKYSKCNWMQWWLFDPRLRYLKLQFCG